MQNQENKAFGIYMTQVAKTQTLSAEQEKSLSDRIKSGDGAALDQLVTANLRLVVAIARKYQAKGLDMDDLVSEGNMGLMKAALKFDADKGPFAAYAVPLSCQGIEMALRQQTALYHVPATERTPAEKKRSRALSMDAPIGHRNRATLTSVLADKEVPDDEQLLGMMSAQTELEVALTQLNERERKVVSLFYGIGCDKMTFAEIASVMGLKRERCRQIRNKALRKVHKGLKQFMKG